MKRLSQILDKTADVCGHIGSGLVPIMVVMVAVEVFMRYVLKNPPMVAPTGARPCATLPPTQKPPYPLWSKLLATTSCMFAWLPLQPLARLAWTQKPPYPP